MVPTYMLLAHINAELQISETFFKIRNYVFVGYFDPINMYTLILKITNFRGDLTDVSA